MNCLTYPFIQKIYSALTSFNLLLSSNDFYESVGYIDDTLTSIRSVFLYLKTKRETKDNQKLFEILNTPLLNLLKIERNSTVHEKPFPLSIQVIITVYISDGYQKNGEIITEYLGDTSLRSFIDSIFDNVLKNQSNTLASVDIAFNHKDKQIDMIQALKSGIDNLIEFMQELKTKYSCTCQSCQKLVKKIDEKYSALLMKKISSFSFEVIIQNNSITIPERSCLIAQTTSGTINECKDYLIPFDKDPIINGKKKPIQILQLELLKNIVFLEMNDGQLLNSVLCLHENSYSIEPYPPLSPITHRHKLKQYSTKIQKDKSIQAIIHIFEMVTTKKNTTS